MIGDIFASVRTSHDYALLCDGSAIPNGFAFTELKSLVGNNTPDLRDYVLKGKRANRTVLDIESDSLKTHGHTGSVSQYVANTTSGGSHVHSCYVDSWVAGGLTSVMKASQQGYFNNYQNAGGNYFQDIKAGSAGDHFHNMTHTHTVTVNNFSGSTENLVKNKSVNYFIYYREENALNTEQATQLTYIYNNFVKLSDISFTDLSNKVWTITDLLKNSFFSYWRSEE